VIINNPLTFRYVDDPKGGFGRLVNIETMKGDVSFSVNETSTTFGNITNIVEKEVSDYFLVNENQQRLYLKDVQVYVKDTGYVTLDTSLVGKMVLGKKSGRIEYTKLNDVTLISDVTKTASQIFVENNIGILLSADAPLDSAMILVREK